MKLRGFLVFGLFVLLGLCFSSTAFAESTVNCTVQITPPSLATLDKLTPKIDNSLSTGLAIINEVTSSSTAKNLPATIELNKPVASTNNQNSQASSSLNSFVDSPITKIDNSLTAGLAIMNEITNMKELDNLNSDESNPSNPSNTPTSTQVAPSSIDTTENLTSQIDNNLVTDYFIIRNLVNTVTYDNFTATTSTFRLSIKTPLNSGPFYNIHLEFA